MDLGSTCVTESEDLKLAQFVPERPARLGGADIRSVNCPLDGEGRSALVRVD